VVVWEEKPSPGEYQIEVSAASWDGPYAQPSPDEPQTMLADVGAEHRGAAEVVTLRVGA
jgi:hypothetical protein